MRSYGWGDGEWGTGVGALEQDGQRIGAGRHIGIGDVPRWDEGMRIRRERVNHPE
jgi:hypothetical protein